MPQEDMRSRKIQVIGRLCALPIRYRGHQQTRQRLAACSRTNCSTPASRSTCAPNAPSVAWYRARFLLFHTDSASRLYHDQLAMTERHLQTLIGDTNGALELLESLSLSFRSVEEQTTSFQS